MLFQRAASVSTSPLLWKGPEDRRIRLQLVSAQDAEGQAQSGSLAVFLGVQPSAAQLAKWGGVRTWSLPTTGVDHGGGCACCQGGGQLGRFLISLIQERARGECVFFQTLCLICLPQDRTGLMQALQSDSLVFSLYGLEAVSSRFSCLC